MFAILIIMNFTLTLRFDHQTAGALHYGTGLLAFHWLRRYRTRARHPSAALLRHRAEQVSGRGARETFGDIIASP